MSEEETKPHEHQLFEDETKLEEHSFSWPLLLVFSLVVLLIGGAGYWYYSSQQNLDTKLASDVVSGALNVQGPAAVHFHAGIVTASKDEKPGDPHYRLLENAGILKAGKTKKPNAIVVKVTPLGERELAKLPELKKWKNPDGSDSYAVPLATRQLVQINRITMNGPNNATVEYTWKWVPNKIGESFDASGPMVQKFPTYERATLIKSYGVDFYKEPQKGTVSLVRAEKGWKISNE